MNFSHSSLTVGAARATALDALRSPSRQSLQHECRPRRPNLGYSLFTSSSMPVTTDTIGEVLYKVTVIYELRPFAFHLRLRRCVSDAGDGRVRMAVAAD